jgi:hypothetical protein
MMTKTLKSQNKNNITHYGSDIYELVKRVELDPNAIIKLIEAIEI